MWRKTMLVFLLVTAASATQAQAGVIFFSNNQAGFTAAMAGSTSLGTEDFEGSTLAPSNVVAMDDPLTQGVANAPYPTGLTLPFSVQSNTLAGAAATTSPRGFSGLAAASAGFSGSTSDVVVANTFTDSLDLLFSASDQIVGVGFNTVNFYNVATLTIQVYDTLNNLLGSTTINGDPTALNFLGIQATGGDLIGRINIYSTASPTGDGAEGADNVQLYTAAVPEPGTLTLLAVGLLCGRAASRRRKAIGH